MPISLMTTRARTDSLPMTQVILVRHAESMPSPDIQEADWPLSPRGLQQAECLARGFRAITIDAIFSSPYRRAVDTVRSLSAQTGREIQIEQNLRERKVCDELGRDRLELLRKAWADFGFALPGCESGHDCQGRMVECIRNLADRHSGQTMIVVSHGNAIALYLNSIDASFGFSGWEAMKNPDVFRVNYMGGDPTWIRS